MKVYMQPLGNGALGCTSEEGQNRLKKLSNNKVYTVEIKEYQDATFHRRLMKMIRFAFDHWEGNFSAIQSAPHQYDAFREELTKLAGYYDQCWNLDGQTFYIKAKSLKFNKMSMDERREFYNAILNVIWEKVGNEDQSFLIALNRF